MAVTLMIAVAIISKKRRLRAVPPRAAQRSARSAAQALKSFWALFFPLGIIMGMRFGIFTPTEAGGVGVLYCLIVGKFVYKGLRKEHFVPILRETISGHRHRHAHHRVGDRVRLLPQLGEHPDHAAQRRVELWPATSSSCCWS